MIVSISHTMPKHATSDPRSLYRMLASPLAEFLNHGKLIASARFVQLIELATNDALQNNPNYAIQLLTAFSRTPYQASLARWFEDRCAVAVNINDSTVSVRKRPKAVPRAVHLREYFPESVKAHEAHQRELKIASLEAKNKVVEHSSQIDMMEAGRRIPGSFENGKRR